MASRMLGSSLGGRAARCSPAGSHANAATSARAAVSLTQEMYHAAFTSAVNDGDVAPATGSEEDRKRMAAPIGEKGPLDRAAEKASEVAGKAMGTATEKVKEAGRVVKDQAMEVGDDVKEGIKETRP